MGALRVAAILAASCTIDAAAGDVNAMFALGIKSALQDLPVDFERATGHRLAMTFEPPGPAAARLAKGETFDVIAMPREAMDKLAAEGRLAQATMKSIARSELGVGIRKGAARPDVSSPDALKRALLSASSVVHSDPARGGAGGVGAVALFERLGIAPQMRAKTVYPRVHSPAGVAQEVTDGRAEIAINALHELSQAGLEVAGAFPESLARPVVFVAAIAQPVAHPEAARALVEFLSGPQGVATLRAHGLSPP